MKYTINTSKCSLKKLSIILVSFKIHLSTIKNTFLCFNIHMYTFQICCDIFQKPYILLTYITILLLYCNVLPYASIYVGTVLKPLYSAPICLVKCSIIFNDEFSYRNFCDLELDILSIGMDVMV
jgi:hypothetical protein